MRRAPRPCLRPRCPEFVVGHDSYCSRHKVGGKYGRDWRTIRARVLMEERRCRFCGGPAEVVDHIVPRSAGGTDRRSNLQALCTRCHNSKTGSGG